MVDSTNPRIMADNIRKLEGKIKANDVVANPTGDTTDELTKIEIDGVKYAIIGETTAEDVSYNNTDSGLTADDVQYAIDEVSASIAAFKNFGSLKFITSETTNTQSTYTVTDMDYAVYLVIVVANPTYSGAALVTFRSSSETPNVIKVGADVISADTGGEITYGVSNYYKAYIYKFTDVNQ